MLLICSWKKRPVIKQRVVVRSPAIAVADWFFCRPLVLLDRLVWCPLVGAAVDSGHRKQWPDESKSLRGYPAINVWPLIYRHVNVMPMRWRMSAGSPMSRPVAPGGSWWPLGEIENVGVIVSLSEFVNDANLFWDTITTISGKVCQRQMSHESTLYVCIAQIKCSDARARNMQTGVYRLNAGAERVVPAMIFQSGYVSCDRL